MSEQHSEATSHQALIRYDAMCQAIAACAKVDEIKGIRDQAIALEHYSRVAQNHEAEAQCAEIRLRAEHKAGRILKQMTRSQGKRTDKPTSSLEEPKSFAEQLEEHGITKKQAETWQRLADVSEAQLEQSLTQSFVDREVPTTSGIISGAFPKPPPTIEANDTWLCDWLVAFEAQGMLGSEPAVEFSKLNPEMQDKVHRLAPSVSDWLWQLAPAPSAA